MHKFGEIVLATVQFTDTYEIKRRPAFVLFEEMGNVVVMGITSNLEMKGVELLKGEGAIKDSIIKINYIFTISKKMIEKILFSVSGEKQKIVREELLRRVGK